MKATVKFNTQTVNISVNSTGMVDIERVTKPEMAKGDKPTLSQVLKIGDKGFIDPELMDQFVATKDGNLIQW